MSRPDIMGPAKDERLPLCQSKLQVRTGVTEDGYKLSWECNEGQGDCV